MQPDNHVLALHQKIDTLDKRFDELSVQQALQNQSMSQMAKALDRLVDLRTETGTLIRSIEQNNRDHDEVFGRLRKIEVTQAACAKSHESTNTAIANLKESTNKSLRDLEDDKKWLSRLVIGAIIIAILGVVITH